MTANLFEDFRLSCDRIAFARAAGIEPDDWQREALSSTHRRLLFNCCRQSGKSTIAAILAAHEALYKPGSLTLMVSRSLDHSGELFRKALSVYRVLGRPVPPESETKLSLTLKNRSRIVARPGASDTAVRGYSASLLLVDEAARVPNEMWGAATPVLAVTGGRVIALSTPYGRRGWWHEEWASERDWHRIKVTADEVDRISPLFLAEERSRKTEREFRQEYYGEFEEPEGQLIPDYLIERAVRDDDEIPVAGFGWKDFEVPPDEADEGEGETRREGAAHLDTNPYRDLSLSELERLRAACRQQLAEATSEEWAWELF